MARFIAIIASAVIFALIGLGAGFLAIENLAKENVSASIRDTNVMVLSIAPTIGGAVLGLIIGSIAAMLTRKADGSN
jgi:hypothetical protein